MRTARFSGRLRRGCVVDTPWADPPGRHTLGDTLPHPPGQIPPRQTPSWADTLWADIPLGWHFLGRHPLSHPQHTPTQLRIGIHSPAHCMLGYTPPAPLPAGIHTPLPIACWDTPQDRRNNTRMWKHYLPATTVAGGKKTICFICNCLKIVVFSIWPMSRNVSRNWTFNLLS